MGEIQEIGKTLPQTKDIVNDVRKILRTARRHAVRTINTDMVAASFCLFGNGVWEWLFICQPAQHASILYDISGRTNLLHTVYQFAVEP